MIELAKEDPAVKSAVIVLLGADGTLYRSEVGMQSMPGEVEGLNGFREQ